MVSVFFLVDTSIFPTNPQSPLVKHPKRKDGKPFGHTPGFQQLVFRGFLSGTFVLYLGLQMFQHPLWNAAKTSISEAEAAFLEDLLGAPDGRGKKRSGIHVFPVLRIHFFPFLWAVQDPESLPWVTKGVPFVVVQWGLWMSIGQRSAFRGDLSTIAFEPSDLIHRFRLQPLSRRGGLHPLEISISRASLGLGLGFQPLRTPREGTRKHRKTRETGHS